MRWCRVGEVRNQIHLTNEGKGGKMSHEADVITMHDHRKILEMEREKHRTAIENLAAHWRAVASSTEPEGGVEQRTLLACVAGLMGLINPTPGGTLS